MRRRELFRSTAMVVLGAGVSKTLVAYGNPHVNASPRPIPGGVSPFGVFIHHFPLAAPGTPLANISERRIENLVNPDISGLPPFLAHEPGIESGLMIPQVVAAALASENKVLAHPASVDTVPTSANREDHVSMGVTAARHAFQVLENTEKVLAIELLSATQGLDCGEPLLPGKGVRAAYECIRAVVPPLESDRFLAPDLAAIEELVKSGALRRAVAAVRGVTLAMGELRADDRDSR